MRLDDDECVEQSNETRAFWGLLLVCWVCFSFFWGYERSASEEQLLKNHFNDRFCSVELRLSRRHPILVSTNLSWSSDSSSEDNLFLFLLVLDLPCSNLKKDPSSLSKETLFTSNVTSLRSDKQSPSLSLSEEESASKFLLVLFWYRDGPGFALNEKQWGEIWKMTLLLIKFTSCGFRNMKWLELCEVSRTRIDERGCHILISHGYMATLWNLYMTVRLNKKLPGFQEKLFLIKTLPALPKTSTNSVHYFYIVRYFWFPYCTHFHIVRI